MCWAFCQLALQEFPVRLCSKQERNSRDCGLHTVVLAAGFEHIAKPELLPQYMSLQLQAAYAVTRQHPRRGCRGSFAPSACVARAWSHHGA